MGAALARADFTAMLFVNMLWSTAVMMAASLLPVANATYEGICIVVLHLAWRIVLLLAPWIKCLPDDDYMEQWSLALDAMDAADEECREQGVPPRPLVILTNYTSSIDPIALLTKFPSKVVWRCRSYLNTALYRVPLFGLACRCAGHFDHQGRTGAAGGAERLVRVDRALDAHLRRAGWLCVFPEGDVNNKSEAHLPLWFGILRKALEYDARIVLVVLRGSEEVWPARAAFGGHPGSLRYSLRNVAPNGACAFVDLARTEGAKEERDMQDHEVLGVRMQELLQMQYDILGQPRDQFLRNASRKNA